MSYNVLECDIVVTELHAYDFVIKGFVALAGVAQWIECQPENQRVTSWIPSVGHVPELQARSAAGGGREATTHGYFFPSLFSLPLSKN